MNLDEDEAETLFPSGRGDETAVSDLTFYMSIERQEDGLLVELSDETLDVTSDEVAMILDECNFDSIWAIFSNKFKFLEHLRQHRC